MSAPVSGSNASFLVADASAVGMGWSKSGSDDAPYQDGGSLSTPAANFTVRQRSGKTFVITQDGRSYAVPADKTGSRDAMLAWVINSINRKDIKLSSGGDGLFNMTDVGAGVRQAWNSIKNQPVPGLGMTANQVVQGVSRNYNAAARSVNQTLHAPVLPVAELVSSFASVRARADAVVDSASKRKFHSVADLAHFGGDNKAANRLRGEVNKLLEVDKGAQAAGFSDWKQVLTGAERGQFDRTLEQIRNDTPAKPLAPKSGNLLSGIARNANQILAPFNARLPTAQDDSLQTMRGGANLALHRAGLPKLNELSKLDFNDLRRAKAEKVLSRYLYGNNLFGALAKLPGGKSERIDHWTDLFAPSELKQFVGGMEKTLLPKAVALSGVNDPEGKTIQVPKQEAFNQIGAIKKQVEDYFGGAWPDAAKPLLGTLDALQSFTLDRQVDALRGRLTQSGRPIDKLVSMGIGFARTANPMAAIAGLVQLDREIAKTHSTKPLEQALAAMGMQFKDVAGVGKDLGVALARGDTDGAKKLLASKYDLNTIEGQDRATGAINTLLAVYGGAKLTQAGLKKLGLFKDPNASALVPGNQITTNGVKVGGLAAALNELKDLSARVNDAIAAKDFARLGQLKSRISDVLSEAKELGGGNRSTAFRDARFEAGKALHRIDQALNAPVSGKPTSINRPVARPTSVRPQVQRSAVTTPKLGGDIRSPVGADKAPLVNPETGSNATGKPRVSVGTSTASPAIRKKTAFIGAPLLSPNLVGSGLRRYQVYAAAGMSSTANSNLLMPKHETATVAPKKSSPLLRQHDFSPIPHPIDPHSVKRHTRASQLNPPLTTDAGLANLPGPAYAPHAGAKEAPGPPSSINTISRLAPRHLKTINQIPDIDEVTVAGRSPSTSGSPPSELNGLAKADRTNVEQSFERYRVLEGENARPFTEWYSATHQEWRLGGNDRPTGIDDYPTWIARQYDVRESAPQERSNQPDQHVHVAFFTNELPLDPVNGQVTHPTSLGGGGMYADVIPPALVDANAVDSAAYFVPGSRGVLEVANLRQWPKANIKVRLPLSRSSRAPTSGTEVYFDLRVGKSHEIPVFVLDDNGTKWIKSADGRTHSLHDLDFFGGALFAPEIQNALNYAFLMFMKAMHQGPTIIAQNPKFYFANPGGVEFPENFKPNLVMNGIHQIIGKIRKDPVLRNSMKGLDVLHVFDGYSDPLDKHFFNTRFDSQLMTRKPGDRNVSASRGQVMGGNTAVYEPVVEGSAGGGFSARFNETSTNYNMQLSRDFQTDVSSGQPLEFDLTANAALLTGGRIVVNSNLISEVLEEDTDALAESFGTSKNLNALYASFLNPLNIDHPVNEGFMVAASHYWDKPIETIRLYRPIHTEKMSRQSSPNDVVELAMRGRKPAEMGFRKIDERLLERSIQDPQRMSESDLSSLNRWKDNNRGALQRMLGLTTADGTRVMAYTSRPRYKHKAMHALILALDKALAADPKLQFVIVADNEAAFDRTPGEMLDTLMRKYPNQVRHTQFNQQLQFMANLGSDFVFMTSTLETFGMANTAAMAAGTPVIASPVGGVVTTSYDAEKRQLVDKFRTRAEAFDRAHPSSDFTQALDNLAAAGSNAIWIDQPASSAVELERQSITRSARNLFEVPENRVPPATSAMTRAIGDAIVRARSMNRQQYARMVASALSFTHGHLTAREIGRRYGTYIRAMFNQPYTPPNTRNR